MWMMWSLEMTSGDFETTSQFGTWKRMQESCQRLQQLLEVTATAGSCGWVAGEAHNMTENYLSILIVSFSRQLQQIETSDRKLSIFQPGLSAEKLHFWLLEMTLLPVFDLDGY